MARRKRASMREGPLADLFRSTEAPDDPPEPPEHPKKRKANEPKAKARAARWTRRSDRPAPSPR